MATKSCCSSGVDTISSNNISGGGGVITSESCCSKNDDVNVLCSFDIDVDKKNNIVSCCGNGTEKTMVSKDSGYSSSNKNCCGSGDKSMTAEGCCSFDKNSSDNQPPTPMEDVGCCSSGKNCRGKDEPTSSSMEDAGCCSSGTDNCKLNLPCTGKTSTTKQKQDCCRQDCCSGDYIDIACNDTPTPTKSCCDGGTGSCCPSTKKKTKTLTCLAIIRPDNSAVDIFDTKGKSKTFVFNNRRIKDLSDKKLCFNAHGKTNDDIDMMVTPVFNSYGGHDEPDEMCPCGEEDSHLHAHIYNPEICGVDDCCMTDAIQKKASNWNFLSQLTFYLDDGKDKKGGEHTHMPINDHLPSQCNSGDMQNQLSQRGLKLSHWLNFRNGGRTNTQERCNNQACGDTSCKDHLYPIQHEDHVDFLIHNEETGALHLEHPNCDSCGNSDIHGRFRLLHTRSWMADKETKINLHFFQVHKEPFRLLDVLTGLFELESSRVQVATRPLTAEKLVKDLASRVGRSNLLIKDGMCCASEVPQIENILNPLDSVEVISVNPTTKRAVVDHNVDIISAEDIAKVLTNQGFTTVVKIDAAVAMEQVEAGIPTDVFVNSEFDLTSIMEDTNKGKIGEVIQTCLKQKFTKKQIKNIYVNEEKELLTIEHNPYYLTAPGIVSYLSKLGYDNVKILSDGGADGMWALSSMMRLDTEESIDEQSTSVRWPVVLSGVFWLISMLSFIGGNWEYLKYVALLSVAFGLPSIAIKAFRTMRRCRFDVNCMMLFAAVGALPLQEYTEAAAVTFLFSISETLEHLATTRARNALAAIVSLRPEYANVINPVTSEIVVLSANSVAVGTTVSVRPGDKIPCDGIVVEGKSAIDESSLTGESRPVGKSTGDTVSGGTINVGDCRLVIKTTASSNDSAVARLIRLIEEAQVNRSETEKLVDSFAKIYTPVVILLALCMCTIPWAFGNEVGAYWAKNGLITIVIACPCALIISTPITYVAGLAASSQRGVIVKGGQHLESLGRVKSIAFDKTGTLTQGVFALLHFNVVGETRSRKEVLGYLALVEAPASHPLSDAIVKGAANEQVEVPKLQLSNHTLLPGEGITANVAGKEVYVGNRKLFDRLGLYEDLPEDVKIMTNEWANAGGTTGFISIEGEGIVGTYCVADKIREEAKDVVQALQRMGIEITMLTGDQRPAAIGIGAQICLSEEDVLSQLLPEDKLSEIGNKVERTKANKKCWQPKKTVLMVGDGVNDAPSLALADVSVAMGEGAALAMDTADVTLMDSNLNKLLYTLRMGRRVIRTIIENVTFSLAVKAIVGGFAFAGRASLWAALASDVGAMLVVTLNGMKLLPSSKKIKKNDLAPSNPNSSNENEEEAIEFP